MFIFGPFDFAQDKFLDLRCSTGARAGVSIANFSACTPRLCNSEENQNVRCDN